MHARHEIEQKGLSVGEWVGVGGWRVRVGLGGMRWRGGGMN